MSMGANGASGPSVREDRSRVSCAVKTPVVVTSPRGRRICWGWVLLLGGLAFVGWALGA